MILQPVHVWVETTRIAALLSSLTRLTRPRICRPVTQRVARQEEPKASRALPSPTFRGPSSGLGPFASTLAAKDFGAATLVLGELLLFAPFLLAHLTSSCQPGFIAKRLASISGTMSRTTTATMQFCAQSGVALGWTLCIAIQKRTLLAILTRRALNSRARAPTLTQQLPPRVWQPLQPSWLWRPSFCNVKSPFRRNRGLQFQNRSDNSTTGTMVQLCFLLPCDSESNRKISVSEFS